MSKGRTSAARMRRAVSDADAARRRPLYARALKLKHIHPSGLMCFLFFEGSVALAVLLALAELVDWLAVGVLPLSIAVMVKINDVIAGAGSASAPPQRPARTGAATGRAVVVTSRVVTDYHDTSEETFDTEPEFTAGPEPDDYDESPRLSRQRNEPIDTGDVAQRARQSAMYRYE